METATMGRVLVTAKIENMGDLELVRRGQLKPEEVRSVEVTDALVDTGASTLSLPARFIAQLGLYLLRTRPARTSAGTVQVRIYAAARVTVQGRDCPTDVIEVPDDCPVLIGQIPLEAMDFVVDPKNQRLIGNPEHGGEQMVDLY